MTERLYDDFQGCDVSCFKDIVREAVLCSTCYKARKDPGLCRNKDHIFCFADVSRCLIYIKDAQLHGGDPLN